MKAIIGKKVGMSQIFDENGKVIPVTVIEAGPCTVVQKKTAEKEGYAAVQLGFEDVPERKLTKPEMGHLNKAGVAPKKYLREFDLENAAELNAGDIIKAIAPICGGKGGGKPDSAMGGGTEVSKVDDALAAVDDLVLKVVG